MIKRLTAIIILLIIAALPEIVVADQEPDFDIADGHFYTQGSGLEPSRSRVGYRLTDEDDLPFYTTFRRLGGVPVLGYPISQRFQWQNKVTQVTQRGVLQWDESVADTIVFDILDYLSAQGWDDWLVDQKSIPKRLSALVDGSSDPVETGSYLSLLDQDSEIAAFYQSRPNAFDLLGWPTSNAQDFGPFIVMRFQRGALQRWKVDTELARAGEVTPVNVGEIAKELGIFPEAAMAPEDAPAPVPLRRHVASRGGFGASHGLATWYGASFQGSLMRNGEPFDMYDPSIAASTTYPLETRLRVTSVATGRSVVVRVTDTGAFHYPIIVDLSWAAFGKIADPSAGTIEVVVEPLRDR